MTVGVVGAGTMGAQMVRALGASGFEVVVQDLIPAAAEAAAEAPHARAVGSVRELAEAADKVLLSLPDPAAVAVCVGELLSVPSPPQAIVDLSTVDQASTRARYAEAADVDVAYVDAPVLGRPHRCGRWTLPVGGTAAAVESVRPLLDVLADRVIHAGDSGAGNVIKLLNNLMFGAINAVSVEVVVAAARLGVDQRVFFETVSESNAATVSNLFREIVPKMIEGDTSPDFSLDLLQKDNQLALEMIREVGLPVIVGSAVTCLNALGVDRGDGALDTSALTRVFDRPD